MAEKRKCEHPACNCSAPKTASTAANIATTLAETLELSSNCGHPGCAEELTHRG